MPSETIAEIRALTSRPFAMNLWVSMEDAGARTSTEAAFNRGLAPLAGHPAALGASRPAYQPYSPPRFEDQARVLLEANVPVFSFIFGIPPREIMEECRTRGIMTIGTAFLACKESGASRLHREALIGGHAGRTALTKGFTGRLARGIHNRLLEDLNRSGTEILPYPLQRALVRNLSTAADAAGRSDLLPLWAGQSAGLSTGTDATALLTSLVEDLADIAGPVARWSASRHQHVS